MADRLTRSQECRQHGLMMPMPDSGGNCWYCAPSTCGPLVPFGVDPDDCTDYEMPVPVTGVLDAIRERRVG